MRTAILNFQFIFFMKGNRLFSEKVEQFSSGDKFYNGDGRNVGYFFCSKIAPVGQLETQGRSFKILTLGSN